ncbi:hypothetical protein [Streptomyces sp. NPDC059080]
MSCWGPGRSAAVLLRMYAKALAKTRERANNQIEDAMRDWNEPE